MGKRLNIFLSVLLCGTVVGVFSAPALAIDGPYENSFDVQSVSMENLVGRVSVEVGGETVNVVVTGKQRELDHVRIDQKGDQLHIVSDRKNRREKRPFEEIAHYQITVPAQTDFRIDKFVGEADIGDLDSELYLYAHYIEAEIGNVDTGSLNVSGSGRVVLGDVSKDLALVVSGSADAKVKSAGDVQIKISGSGNLDLGDVSGALNVSVSGSGSINVASVAGSVRAEISGSGDLVIGSGQADPFVVRTFGAGNVTFRGNAVNPNITTFGSGRVRINSYSGKLTQTGQSRLIVEN